MQEQFKQFQEDFWVTFDGDVFTLGLLESSVEHLNEVMGIDLPEDGHEVSTDTVFGEVETDEGPINLYTPLDGVVVETNEAVMSDYRLVLEDPQGDGWLVKVQADDILDLEQFSEGQEETYIGDDFDEDES